MAPGRIPRILIVEDEEFLQEMYKDLLPPQGFQIVGMVADGDHVLPEISAMAESPDLVILDHRLPGKCGLDVMVEIAERFPQMKVMMISADTAICEAALKAGTARFLAKPFHLGDLFLAMHEVLDPER